MRTVTVTIEDLRNGRARHPYYSALVLAIQRAVPEADTVRVDHLTGRVVLSMLRYRHRNWTADLLLPEEARKFLGGEFDPHGYGRPRPITLEIDPIL